MTAGIDPARPGAARIYDYLLGGKDNCAVDRAAARAQRVLDVGGQRVLVGDALDDPGPDAGVRDARGDVPDERGRQDVGAAVGRARPALAVPPHDLRGKGGRGEDRLSGRT